MTASVLRQLVAEMVQRGALVGQVHVGAQLVDNEPDVMCPELGEPLTSGPVPDGTRPRLAASGGGVPMGRWLPARQGTRALEVSGGGTILAGRKSS